MTTTTHGFHMDTEDNKQVVNLKDCKCSCNQLMEFLSLVTHIWTGDVFAMIY